MIAHDKSRDILESKTEKYQWLDYFTEHQNIDRLTRTENNLADIAALQSFDKETLSKVIERVYVYGVDRVEIIWKTDDI